MSGIDAKSTDCCIISINIIEKPLYYEPFMAYVPKDNRLFPEKFIDNTDLQENDLLLLK